jgi:hypothetical protein
MLDGGDQPNPRLDDVSRGYVPFVPNEASLIWNMHRVCAYTSHELCLSVPVSDQ